MHQLDKQDKLEINNIKFAQGLGASLRYANELRAAQQIGRLAPLTSSHLQEDVLRGHLGPTGIGSTNIFQRDEEDSAMFRGLTRS